MHGVWIGFPKGRSPAGDLATAALKACVGDASDLNFTRIGKERERSYFTAAFNETNVMHTLRVMERLGFVAQAHQHRKVATSGESCNWTMHVELERKAIATADSWKDKKLDLAKVVSELA